MATQGVSLKAVRTARIAFIGMTLLYVRVGEMNGPGPRPVNPSLRFAVYVFAASIIPTIVFVRRRELKRAKDRLARQPGDVSALRRWRAIQLVILACLLAIPLYGLVLRFQGQTLLQVLPFYIVGILLLSSLPIHEAETT